MLNHKGEVAECTGDNIFVVHGSKIHTPSVDSGILEGITRNAVIELARAAGHTVIERTMDRHDVYTADECFLTGTAAEVIPVVECDGRVIGSGPPGPDYPRAAPAVSILGARRALNERGDVIEIKTILAPTDFSAHSEHAVRYACRLAERLGSELHLLHVLSEILPAGPDPLLMPVMPAAVLQGKRRSGPGNPEPFARPVLGQARRGRDGRQMGQPGRVDRFVCRRSPHRPDHHRHPRPIRPEPRPPGLGGRADRPRVPLPGPHHPRSQRPAHGQLFAPLDPRSREITRTIASMHRSSASKIGLSHIGACPPNSSAT